MKLKQTQLVQFRLTKVVHKAAIAAAESQGLSLADYARTALYAKLGLHAASVVVRRLQDRRRAR